MAERSGPPEKETMMTTETITPTPALQLISLIGRMLKDRPAYEGQSRDLENLRKVYRLCEAEDGRWTEFLSLWASQTECRPAANAATNVLRHAAKLARTEELAWDAEIAHREVEADRVVARAKMGREAPEADVDTLRRQNVRKVTEDGMYRVPQTGEIFKVQRNAAQGDGSRLYAKQLVLTVAAGPHGEGRVWQLKEIPLGGESGLYVWDARFKYAPGAVLRLLPEDRMTMEQARAFGALYGTCCRCGRTLTDEASIAAGIGPVCAGKL